METQEATPELRGGFLQDRRYFLYEQNCRKEKGSIINTVARSVLGSVPFFTGSI